MLARRLLLATAICGLATLPPALAGEDPTPLDPECAVPETMLGFAEGMDEVIETLRTGRPVTIVALGSSSTEGVGVDSPELTYPARLQAELAKRFPGQEIRVVNRGVGGELAQHMLQRLERDVIPARPDLVIWQTGTNDALAHVDPGEFVRILRQGIERLDAAGVELMLMDLQYFPTVRDPQAYERYVADMAALASSREDVTLFPRFALMHYWNSNGAGTAGLWAGDRFHLGATGYKCVAAVLAEALERSVQGERYTPALPSAAEEAAVLSTAYAGAARPRR